MSLAYQSYDFAVPIYVHLAPENALDYDIVGSFASNVRFYDVVVRVAYRAQGESHRRGSSPTRVRA